MTFENDSLTGQIINAIITVHQKLGPGFMENIYRNALTIELRKRGLDIKPEKEITVYYDGEIVGIHRLDILVEDAVVLELKTVETLHKSHYAQIRSYLKASGCKIGLLVNFAGETADFRRVDLCKIRRCGDSGRLGD